MAIIPPRVRRGDLIGVCAPAGPLRVDRLQPGIDRLGEAFRVRVTPSVTAPRPAGIPSYLAADDDTRAEELTSLLADRDVRAIVLARGGYGIMRILARLDPGLLRADPKPIVGFSDATALLSWAHDAGVRGIHGPMIGQLGELAPDDAATLVTMLTEPRAPGRRPWKLESHGRGTRQGYLIAANLTMASVLIGTPWQLPLANSIALFEEVGERPYELDRYLTHLAISGQLAGVRGVVLGDLVRCHAIGEPDDGQAVPTILERLASLPVALGAPIGHGTRNEAVPFGAACTVDYDAGRVDILDAAVA
jgi:muramoyltetrapeptide carboxypeptidase